MTEPAKKKPLAYLLGENPLRAIEWPLWTLLVLAGLYLFTPAFVPEAGSNSALATTVGSFWAFKLYASIIFSVGMLGLCGLIFHKPRLRKLAAHILFYTFMYFTVLRIILMGPLSLGWITYFFNSLMSAAIVLRIKWEALNGTVN